MIQKYFITEIKEAEDCRISFIGYNKRWISISIWKWYIKLKKKNRCEHKNYTLDYIQFDELEVHFTRSCNDCDFIHKTIIDRRV